MIISIGPGKLFDKIPHLLRIKTQQAINKGQLPPIATRHL